MNEFSNRPTLSLSFDRKARRYSNGPSNGTLSRSELKRIVAEMVG